MCAHEGLLGKVYTHLIMLLYIYIYYKQHSNINYIIAPIMVFVCDKLTKIIIGVMHALCACMRAVFYKKTPQNLEMFSL